MRMPKSAEGYLSTSAMKARAQCLRKHCIALTDRMERMAKPSRRQVLGMWREHHHSLPPETVCIVTSFTGFNQCVNHSFFKLELGVIRVQCAHCGS